MCSMERAVWQSVVYTRQAVYGKRNNMARSRNPCCRGKAICTKCCECLYLSSIRSAFTVLYCHLWPVWLYHILPHGMIFRGGGGGSIKCVFLFSLQLLSETFFTLRRIQ